MQYISFLLSQIGERDAHDSTIEHLTNKTIIIHTASIVEGCLHYALQQVLKKQGGSIDGKYIDKPYRHHDPKRIHVISEQEKIYSYRVVKNTVTSTKDIRHISFQNLIRCCRYHGILTAALEKQANTLREERNKVHLSNIGEIDDTYPKERVNDQFKTAGKLIDRCKTWLSEHA